MNAERIEGQPREPAGREIPGPDVAATAPGLDADRHPPAIGRETRMAPGSRRRRQVLDQSGPVDQHQIPGRAGATGVGDAAVRRHGGQRGGNPVGDPLGVAADAPSPWVEPDPQQGASRFV